MNFKTTIVLLVVLLCVGAYLFFTRDSGSPGDQTKTTTDDHSLLSVKKDEITKVTIVPSSGKKTVLEKTAAASASVTPILPQQKWRVVEPVNAEAEAFEVSGLIDAITQLKSTAHVPNGSSVKTGLDQPQFKVTLTSGGKDTTLLLGDRLAATGGVYARVDGATDGGADVVPGDFLDKIDRPANAYRQPKLVDASTADIKQIRITQKDGSELSLQKTGETWEITSPTKMPAEATAVTDLLGALTGLRAVEFSDDSPATRREKPMLTIWYTTALPSTQPSTAPATQDTGTTITFDGYEDIRKERLVVSVPSTHTTAMVAGTSLDPFRKKPLDLRDKKVVQIKPDEVSTLTISADLIATTQPTTRPGSKTETRIARRKIAPQAMGPTMSPAPTTGATTLPATAMATTKPVEPPPTKWEIVSDPKGDANDSKVDIVLGDLNPLKAEKYIDDPSPTTQPADRYTVSVTTEGAGGAAVTNYEIHLTDPGNEKPVIGEYDGLKFEAPRSVIKNLEGDFHKTPAAK